MGNTCTAMVILATKVRRIRVASHVAGSRGALVASRMRAEAGNCNICINQDPPARAFFKASVHQSRSAIIFAAPAS
jgi:hypothetical protein